LARSSRNELLSEAAKNEATLIYKVLQEARSRFAENSIQKVIDYVVAEFKKHPNFALEYFEIADEETLQTATEKKEGVKYRGFVVAHIDNVRLIDNILLN